MKVNQLKMGVILSYVIIGLNMLIQLFYTPILLRLLGQSEFGLYQLVASVVAYLGMLSFGITSSYVKFYTRYKVSEEEDMISKLNGLFMIVYLIIATVCIICGTLITMNVEIFFSDTLTSSEIYTAKILMMILVINLAISFPGSVIDCYVLANEHYVFQRVLNIFKVIAGPMVTIPLLLIGYRSVAMVVVTTIINFISIIWNLIYTIKKLKMRFTFRNLPRGLFKEIFIFSSFVFINIIIDQINWNTDKFLLGMYSGTVAVAVYGIASQINSIYMTFSTTISSVFAPRINKMIEEKTDMKIVSDLFIKVGRIQYIVLVYVLYIMVFLGKYFIMLWAGEEYKNAYYVMLLLCIPALIALIQNLGLEIQRAMNMHKFRTIAYLLMAVCNIVLSIFLVQKYGEIGAAVGTTISLIIGNGIIMNIYYYKKMHLDIDRFFKEIISLSKGIIVPIVLAIILAILYPVDNIIIFVIYAIILSATYAISVWCMGMNEEEKNLVRKIIYRGKNGESNG